MEYHKGPKQGIIPVPIFEITRSYLYSFPMYSQVTDDKIERRARDLTDVALPPYLYWQGGEHFVYAMRMIFAGETALNEKKTNSQGFKKGDYRVWPSSMPVHERTLNTGWIVAASAYINTYQEVGPESGVYRKARKVGKLRALLIPEPFFVLTWDNDKPFWYESGSILVQQVDHEGKPFHINGRRDLYAMHPNKFGERYSQWSKS